MQLTREIVIEAAGRNKINPYKDSFYPRDLKLRADRYGSFSDYCKNTLSSQYNKSVILEPAIFDSRGRPKKYLLIK